MVGISTSLYTITVSVGSAEQVEVFNVDSRQYQQIQNILNLSPKFDSIIIGALTATNIPIENAAEICKASHNFGTATTLAQYLTSRYIPLSSLDNANIFAILSSTGIDFDFLKWLAKYTWVTNPNMGKGEVIIASLIKDAKRAVEKGDITIDNVELEVKGEGSRIRGFKGYGLGSEVSQTWYNFFKLWNCDPPIPGSNDWNLTKRGFAVDILGQMLVNRHVCKLNDIIECWKSGFKKLYLESIDTDYDFIEESYESGFLNRIKLQNELFLFSLKYYFRIENINQILLSKFYLTDDEKNNPGSLDYRRFGKTMLITENDVVTGRALHKVSRYTLPSFSNLGGSQGAAVALFV